MADRKARLVDGYTTMKAAQQAHKEGKLSEPSAAPDASGAGVAPKPSGGARISRTALPSRVEIVCYECAASFEIVGKTEYTVCTKCRTRLQVVDHTIDKPWAEAITTAGTITLAKGAQLKEGAVLVANRIVLDGGSVGEGHIRASRLIELNSGKFDAACMETLDLKVGEKIRQALDSKEAFALRHVEVLGSFNAVLELSGVLRIRAGGCFRGSVTGEHLEVEEGGGLKAELQIKPGPGKKR